MKIALAQLKLSDNLKDNQEKTIRVMEEAATNGAQLICFPELQFYPFFPQHRRQNVKDYALAIDDPFIAEMQEACRQLSLVAVPNFYLKSGDKHYDASPVINSDGKILGVSKMVHIVQAEGFYEQDYYTQSEDGFKIYETSVGKVGVIICFDRHYPEAIRSCVLRGADIILVPTANTKAEPSDMFEWELRVPAMQNSVYLAMCNRVGLEDAMDFCGESILVHPDGHVVTKANDQEQIVYADVDIDEVRKLRGQNLYLPLRRSDVYER